MPTDLVQLGMLLLIVGAVYAAVVARRRRLCAWGSFIFVLAASVAASAAGLRVLFYGGARGAVTLAAVPGIGASFALRVDNLTAVFLVVISVAAVPAALFAVRYLQGKSASAHRRFYPMLLLFVASLLGVASSWDVLFFLVFWEFMTLTSYVLVVHDRDNTTVLRAGLKYFIVTHVATACLIAAAIITYSYGGQSFSFDALRAGIGRMSQDAPVLLHVVLGLFFVGFATKVGTFPFGDWLPDAYPAAPAPASAVFAGTMTKLGIYGLVRVFCQALPVSETCQTWGVILAGFGTASLALGTLTALVQDDTKRMLSFHVIGQLGYILLAVGLGVYFRPLSPALSVVAMVGALFHVFNDACYLPCLFLNAGAVEHRTGTRDLNAIGGLGAVMPVTAVAAVVASLSISGMPAFSGFSSKWLMYHASIMGGRVAPFSVAFGLIAIFVAIVTLASFLKFIASGFLGKLRTPEDDETVSEVSASMTVPQVALGALCVLFGVAPMLAARPIYSAVSGVFGRAAVVADFTSLFGSGWAGFALNTGVGPEGAWVPWPMLVALGATAFVAYLVYKAGGAQVQISSVWYCGEEHTDEEAAYRAHSFYRPFKELLRVRIGSWESEGLWPRLPRLRAPNLMWLRRAFDFDSWAYYPLVRLGRRLVERFSATHVGIAQVYLLWMLVGIVAGVVVMLALGHV